MDVLIATGRITARRAGAGRAERSHPKKRHGQREDGAPIPHQEAGRADYARRKAIVEPVFGQMKVRQGAGLLRLRGFEGAQGEWPLHSLCHNLRKLAQASA